MDFLQVSQHSQKEGSQKGLPSRILENLVESNPICLILLILLKQQFILATESDASGLHIKFSLCRISDVLRHRWQAILLKSQGGGEGGMADAKDYKTSVWLGSRKNVIQILG